MARPNRFIANVAIEGQAAVAHVKNTGRCRELLVPGCTVYLALSDNPDRKTRYDLVAVEKLREGKPPLLINMDSQAPNAVAAEWLARGELFSRGAHICREVTHGTSRFDIYVEDGDRKAFVEVKGVTLEQEGLALFPDAPTVRGVKHLEELTACAAQGYEAYLLFVAQMKGVCAVRPNDATHQAFGEALRCAERSGVRLLAVDCLVTPESLVADRELPVLIDENPGILG